MIRWTFVCEDCHAGWQFDTPDLAVHDGKTSEKTRCRWCGELGKARGVYVIQPVT